MPSLEGGGVNLRNILDTVVSFVKSKTGFTCTAPCDGLVLKMHYRWTFFIFLGSFLSVWYSWYHRDVITCVSHFNAEAQVRLDYINICLSYPYLVNEDESRRYLLFYRWTHYTFLFLAALYYIPRKVSKTLENPKVKELVEQMAKKAFMNSGEGEAEVVVEAARYISHNKHTHNGLYIKFLAVNFVALIIDLFALHFVDFTLQHRFITYGIEAFPYSRDPQEFTDYMSTTFPPFASCTIDKNKQLTAKRTEEFGCHLTFMELYEKIFLFFWLWFYVLLIITSLYIIFLLMVSLPFFQVFLLRTSKTERAKYRDRYKMRDIVRDVVKSCKVGDVYLLYRLKQHFSHAHFHELLVCLSNEHHQTKENVYSNSNPEFSVLRGSTEDSLRRRKKELLLVESGMTKQIQHGTEHNAPLLKKNTSILIE